MPEPALRAQDVLVLAKLMTYGGQRPPIAQLAADVIISASEVHAALKRLTLARLLSNDQRDSRLRVEAVEEFLLHGIKYIFPTRYSAVTSGMLTSYSVLIPPRTIPGGEDLPIVWPFDQGADSGIALEPLYRTVPLAASRDPVLHELLALIDALRDPDRHLALDLRSLFRT